MILVHALLRNPISFKPSWLSGECGADDEDGSHAKIKVLPSDFLYRLNYYESKKCYHDSATQVSRFRVPLFHIDPYEKIYTVVHELKKRDLCARIQLATITYSLLNARATQNLNYEYNRALSLTVPPSRDRRARVTHVGRATVFHELCRNVTDSVSIVTDVFCGRRIIAVTVAGGENAIPDGFLPHQFVFHVMPKTNAVTVAEPMIVTTL